MVRASGLSALVPASGKEDRAGGGSPYQVFSRQEWAALGRGRSLPIADDEIRSMGGLEAPLSRPEVEALHLPLSRLVEVLFRAARELGAALREEFLSRPGAPTPYVIAIAGSVAVGKSSFARVLRSVLAGLPGSPRVELVATDGFLLPTAQLEKRGLMRRKGYPESYDRRRMLTFLQSVKAGDAELRVPMYSHSAYDIVPDEFQEIRRPDILIFEGLNVLQISPAGTTVASDFFDFSIYLDADSEIIEQWYVRRFLALQRTVFQSPASHFHRYRNLTPAEAADVGKSIWDDINRPNLIQNILPTRERARMVIRKNASHALREVWLRVG